MGLLPRAAERPERTPDGSIGITIGLVVRIPLNESERARGERLGAVLRGARGERSMAGVAAEAGISVETLRKIETGRIPTPAFFTVVAVADAVALPLDQLREALAAPRDTAVESTGDSAERRLAAG